MGPGPEEAGETSRPVRLAKAERGCADSTSNAGGRNVDAELWFVGDGEVLRTPSAEIPGWASTTRATNVVEAFK